MQVSTVHVYLTYPFVLSWSCIEALSAGCAIVASDTAPVRDVIVDGVNGVLAPFHDPSAIAAAICDLLGDAPKREQLSQAARETAAVGFQMQACVRRTLDILGLDLEDTHDGAAPGFGRLREDEAAGFAPSSRRRRRIIEDADVVLS